MPFVSSVQKKGTVAPVSAIWVLTSPHDSLLAAGVLISLIVVAPKIVRHVQELDLFKAHRDEAVLKDVIRSIF